MYVVPAVFVVMSAVGFALMGADKRRAEKGAFRHKTRHVKFVVLLPVAAIFSVAAAAAAEYGVWLLVCG